MRCHQSLPAFFIPTIIDCPVPACTSDHKGPGSHDDDTQPNEQEEGNGNGCPGAYPTCYVERDAHAGPSGAIGKSNHDYRIEAMRTITNASSDANANANANHHHDITFGGDSQEISSTRSGGSRTPLLLFSVRLQNPL